MDAEDERGMVMPIPASSKRRQVKWVTIEWARTDCCLIRKPDDSCYLCLCIYLSR